MALTNYAMLAFTSIANASIFPVFLYTPVKLGGLGLKPFQVSPAAVPPLGFDYDFFYFPLILNL